MTATGDGLMRVKASIEVPGGISWAVDSDTASRMRGVCIVGNHWPKPLFVDGRAVGIVGAIEHMDTDELFMDGATVPMTLVNSTTLNCILYL